MAGARHLVSSYMFLMLSVTEETAGSGNSENVELQTPFGSPKRIRGSQENTGSGLCAKQYELLLFREKSR